MSFIVRRWRNSRDRWNEGAAAVEAAFVLPVLFLFVLMLLNVGQEVPDKNGRPIQRVLGSAAVLVFAGLLLGMFRHSGSRVPAAADPVSPALLGDPAALARLLYSDYLLHFEAVSVLLLAALVGAFVLARREHAS